MGKKICRMREKMTDTVSNKTNPRIPIITNKLNSQLCRELAYQTTTDLEMDLESCINAHTQIGSNTSAGALRA